MSPFPKIVEYPFKVKKVSFYYVSTTKDVIGFLSQNTQVKQHFMLIFSHKKQKQKTNKQTSYRFGMT